MRSELNDLLVIGKNFCGFKVLASARMSFLSILISVSTRSSSPTGDFSCKLTYLLARVGGFSDTSKIVLGRLVSFLPKVTES